MNAPGQRYHPAIVAQAIATLGEMFPGRFWAALGSGEALNEHITGEPWPEKAERNERLLESVEVIRHLTARYRVAPEIGWGTATVLPQAAPGLLVHSLSSDVGRMIAVHNFADTPAVAAVDLRDEPEGTRLLDMLGPAAHGDGPQWEFDVPAYGYLWLRVSRPGDGRLGT